MFNIFPCSKGCEKVFYSEESRVKHENFVDCPNVCFDIISPRQDSMETNMMETTLFEPTSPPTSSSGFNGIWDSNQVACQEVVVTTDYDQHLANMQQPSYGVKSAHDIMSFPTTSNNHLYEQDKKSSRNNRCYEGDFRMIISDATPNILPNYVSEECKEKTYNKTLSELNLVPEDSQGKLMLFDNVVDSAEIEKMADLTDSNLINSLSDLLFAEPSMPIQDPEVSGSQTYEEDSKLSEFTESLLSLFSLHVPCIEQSELPPIPTSMNPTCQPFIQQLRVETYVRDNDDLTFVETTPLVQPVAEVPRKRGRPRKNQTMTVKGSNNKLDSQFNSYANATILLDRRCKVDSLQKIHSLSKESESGFSEQELNEPLVGAECSRKRVRKIPPRYEEQDSDYDEGADSTDTVSHVSSGTLTEDENQKRRKKNNESSKKSRDKRKEQDLQMEILCQKLQERYTYLKENAEKLQNVVETILECIAADKGVNGQIVQVS